MVVSSMMFFRSRRVTHATAEGEVTHPTSDCDGGVTYPTSGMTWSHVHRRVAARRLGNARFSTGLLSSSANPAQTRSNFKGAESSSRQMLQMSAFKSLSPVHNCKTEQRTGSRSMHVPQHLIRDSASLHIINRTFVLAVLFSVGLCSSHAHACHWPSWARTLSTTWQYSRSARLATMKG
jgi:hypothetical protein